MKTLIRGGTIVTEQGTFPGSVLIGDGKVLRVFEVPDGPVEADEVIDASGKYVLPGAVDIHTHMDLDVGIARVIDDFHTGTVAAACGGTTTIVDHMAFGPKGCSPWHQVKEYHRLADGNAVVDYGFHGVLQHVNEQVLEDMAQIAKEEGITSFKIYMTYDFRLDDLDLMKIMQKAAKEGILIAYTSVYGNIQMKTTTGCFIFKLNTVYINRRKGRWGEGITPLSACVNELHPLKVFRELFTAIGCIQRNSGRQVCSGL